jgi:hypothetical protein
MNSDRPSDLPPDLKSLAADLAALAPSSGSVNRDELMYRAGWEACAATSPAVPSTRLRAAAWSWPLSTAALVLIAAALSIVLATREPQVQVVYVEKPPTSSVETEKQKGSAPEHTAVAGQPWPSTSLHTAVAGQPWPSTSRSIAWPAGTGNDYLSLRERVLAFGVDVLPAAPDEPLGTVTPLQDSRYGALIRELRGG